MKKKFAAQLKVYKEEIQKLFSTKNEANINTEEFGKVHDKINEIWTKLKAGEHSILSIRGELTTISSIQNKGCVQSRSVQNKTTRLFVCKSMVENGKSVDSCAKFCPFLSIASQRMKMTYGL